MEDLVQAAVLDAPVANQLGVGGAQVDLLSGQLEEGGVLVRTDVVVFSGETLTMVFQ